MSKTKHDIAQIACDIIGSLRGLSAGSITPSDITKEQVLEELNDLIKVNIAAEWGVMACAALLQLREEMDTGEAVQWCYHDCARPMFPIKGLWLNSLRFPDIVDGGVYDFSVPIEHHLVIYRAGKGKKDISGQQIEMSNEDRAAILSYVIANRASINMARKVTKAMLEYKALVGEDGMRKKLESLLDAARKRNDIAENTECP